MADAEKYARGIGLTVTTEFTAGPTQPFSVGVTVYCTVPAVVAVLVSV